MTTWQFNDLLNWAVMKRQWLPFSLWLYMSKNLFRLFYNNLTIEWFTKLGYHRKAMTALLIVAMISYVKEWLQQVLPQPDSLMNCYTGLSQERQQNNCLSQCGHTCQRFRFFHTLTIQLFAKLQTGRPWKGNACLVAMATDTVRESVNNNRFFHKKLTIQQLAKLPGQQASFRCSSTAGSPTTKISNFLNWTIIIMQRQGLAFFKIFFIVAIDHSHERKF